MNAKAARQAMELVPADEAPRQMVPAGNSPADVMRTLLDRGVSPADLRELLAVQKEYEANEARKEFNKAFADFKAEAISVHKGTTITDGPLKGKRHANLFDVVVASAAPLARHGLSTSWKLTKDEPTLMEVTCVLKHSAGHSESVSMSSAPDTGPGRNAIQARGSAKSYLERYTLMAILGLAATDQDDDDGGRTEPSPEELAAKAAEDAIYDKIGLAETVTELQKVKPEIEALPATGKRNLIASYNVKLRALKGEPQKADPQ